MNLFETEHAQLAQHLAGKFSGVYRPENITITVSAHFARLEIYECGEKVWINITNLTGALPFIPQDSVSLRNRAKFNGLTALPFP